MLSKKPAVPPPEDEPPAEGFRKEMVGLFLRNHIAARKAASVCHKASKAKGQGVEDLAAMGANPQKPARHRDVLRRLLKNRHWPSLYYFQCEVTDLRTQEEVFATLPVWLPHEILQCLEQKTTSLKGLCDHSFLQSQEFGHLSKVANKLACSVDSLVGLSIWGDGVPFNNNRSHSLEMLSLSIMSCCDQGLRIPLAAFPKHLAARSSFLWYVDHLLGLATHHGHRGKLALAGFCLCPVVREVAWEQCGPEVQSFASQDEELLQGVWHWFPNAFAEGFHALQRQKKVFQFCFS